MVTIRILIIPIILLQNFHLAVGSVLFSFITDLFSNDPNVTYSKLPKPPPVFGQGGTMPDICDTPPPSCPQTQFRSLNGSCNNLIHTAWGTPFTTYGRFIGSKYGDGISTFPRAVSGRPLPNSRLLSLLFFIDIPLVDRRLSLLAQQWGQIISHDMSLTDGITQTSNEPVVCCENGTLTEDAFVNPFCAPIIIPPIDPIHRPGSCLEFTRTVTSRDIGCAPRNQSAQQLTIVTSFIDGSEVYGSSDSQGMPLREFTGGLLKTVTRNNREWPPQNPNVSSSCPGVQSTAEPCYLGGDSRINQNTELTMLQVILLLEHNRIAGVLADLNPQWDDETTFQQARSIFIGEYQKITYYDFLPLLLGRENMLRRRLIYLLPFNSTDYINDYNPTVNPEILNEHATAAYRYFHTLIRGLLDRSNENRTSAGVPVRLSNWFNRPLVIELDDIFDELVRGITVEAAAGSDQFFDSEITSFLFRGQNEFGSDLRATDIQRGRDHGLGSYRSARRGCNLSVPRSFHDLKGIISRDNIRLLRRTYDNIEDIDLVVGGSLEMHVPGTLLGPTFLCIITNQFFISRVGDRFFFENGFDPNIAFTPAQLQSIRQASISRILCDNSDIEVMQPNGFLQITPGNFPVPCEDLPSIDLSLWKESPGEWVG